MRSSFACSSYSALLRGRGCAAAAASLPMTWSVASNHFRPATPLSKSLACTADIHSLLGGCRMRFSTVRTADRRRGRSDSGKAAPVKCQKKRQRASSEVSTASRSRLVRLRTSTPSQKRSRCGGLTSCIAETPDQRGKQGLHSPSYDAPLRLTRDFLMLACDTQSVHTFRNTLTVGVVCNSENWLELSDVWLLCDVLAWSRWCLNDPLRCLQAID